MASDQTYEPFKSAFDVEMQLRYHAPGWRKTAEDKDSVTFAKRFGGVWYKVWLPRGYYASAVYLAPSKPPLSLLSLSGADYDAATAPLRATLSIKGLTVAAIESKAEELIAANKKVLTTRKRKDRSSFYFRGEEGAAGLASWKKEVERVLVEILTGGRRELQETRSLALNVLRNYMLEPSTMTYSEASKLVRGVLDSMARRGIIDKVEFSRTKVMWGPR